MWTISVTSLDSTIELNLPYNFILQLANRLVKMNPEEKALQETIVDLKSELPKISMMDEFAKYAKIERKINKLTEERKKHCKLDGST